jgi:hypothetical protein
MTLLKVIYRRFEILPLARISKSKVQQIRAALLIASFAKSNEFFNDAKIKEKLVDLIRLYPKPPRQAIVLFAGQKS